MKCLVVFDFDDTLAKSESPMKVDMAELFEN